MQPLRDLLTANGLQDLSFPHSRSSITLNEALDVIRDNALKVMADAVWEGELNKLVDCARSKP